MIVKVGWLLKYRSHSLEACKMRVSENGWEEEGILSINWLTD